MSGFWRVSVAADSLASRPAVDVVVPFAGTDADLDAARARLSKLVLRPDDTLVVADNRPGAWAGGQPGSYFARNRGAERGTNPWLVFVDADVDPDPGLLDAYFAAAPDARCGVLVGAVVDEPPAGRPPAAVRYAHAVDLMSQARTLARAEWAYAQTANCAVRRAAFAQVGGFAEAIRSGGDADLCFRLRDAGWTLEGRDGARVTHRSRPTVRALLRQRLRVGAGARWLEARYPGFSPRRPLARALASNARVAARAAGPFVRGERDEALVVALGGLADAAFQVGWRLPNRPRAR